MLVADKPSQSADVSQIIDKKPQALVVKPLSGRLRVTAIQTIPS